MADDLNRTQDNRDIETDERSKTNRSAEDIVGRTDEHGAEGEEFEDADDADEMKDDEADLDV